MKIYTTLYIVIRIVAYSLLTAGIFCIIRFDALHPMGEGYFGELSLTEILQEIILFTLFVFYLLFGYKYRKIQPVSNIVSLFFLMSFIREFNFLIDWWLYPVLLIFALVVWLFVRDLKKIKDSASLFFVQPASAWLLAGFLVTFIFSRLFGQSGFWLVLYDENSYRLAKAATEEGIELLGDILMFISSIEFIIFWFSKKNIISKRDF